MQQVGMSSVLDMRGRVGGGEVDVRLPGKGKGRSCPLSRGAVEQTENKKFAVEPTEKKYDKSRPDSGLGLSHFSGTSLFNLERCSLLARCPPRQKSRVERLKAKVEPL